MSNQSDLTRKEQVLWMLRRNANQWIDGPDLANERVGGSEGLRRLRELTQDGHRIQQRRHPNPDRDIWQYRLVVGSTSPVRAESRLTDAVKQRDDGTYEYVAAEPEMIKTPVSDDAGLPEYQFTALPERLDFGSVAVCPRCHARTNRARFGQNKHSLHKDPYHKKGPCIGCLGWGIVPNKGPIPATVPEGMQ